MEKRIGVVGIIVKQKSSVALLNDLLSQHGHLIIGRMGIPHHGAVNIISLIIEGSNDEIGAFTGKVGALPGVIVRSTLTSYIVEGESS